jgi:CDP-glucose 4,6-dehydratase
LSLREADRRSLEFWPGKRVLVTGHTGFKGGWLSLALRRLGAVVTGLALAPETTPNLFDEARLESLVDSRIGDIREQARVHTLIGEIQPDIIFHLAAQPLVRRAQAQPIETFATNIMGTAYLLESLRATRPPAAVVIVTSDKVYSNKEWPWPYRESDELGGREPYGVSKACAELVTEAYARSYLDGLKIPVATARAGNVVGGGDWSADRLVPDAMRAWSAGEMLRIRSPSAVRPWQHVVDAIRGYTLLAARMAEEPSFAGAWNFGPAQEDARPVSWAIDRLAELWGGGVGWELDAGVQPYEAQLLAVDSSRSMKQLGWRPAWRLDECFERTVGWYKAFYGQTQDAHSLTIQDIEAASDADA